ncbi:putative inorganic phosphate cotransporter [Schistocerca americana]|uniref:putative inorganic phosphate cotransporter n=1 Tax=Schistocerca americana TaxID=7009 RepID=UPI001F4FA8EB|nr:putative inorganic phosphate cotransporter [Schistocerca americana]
MSASMSSPSARCRTFTLFPLRAAIAFMGILAILCQYILKVTLSVAIGGMVKPVPQENSVDETCPLPGSANTSSSDIEGGEFEWDEVMQGYILSSYYYGYAGVNIVAGYVAARYSARWVLTIGLLAAGVFTILGPVCASASPVVFMITRILVGTFSGVIIPSMHVLVGKWFPENERQRLGGPIFSASYLGTVISMALSGTIVKNLGWYSVFYIFGGVAIALVIPCLYFIYDEPESHPRITEKEKDFLLTHTGRDLTESKEKKELEKEQDEIIRNPWPAILTCPAMWTHCLVGIGGAWVNYTLLSELPTYMENILHYDIDEAGLISALPYLFGWMSCSIYSFLTERLTRRGVHIMTIFRAWDAVSCFGPAICFLALTFIDCDVPAIITLFVFTMVFRCAIYGGSYLNHIYLFPRAYGSAAGLFLTLANSTGIITPIVTSAFVSGRETVQQWKYVFYVAMTISFIPYFVFLIFGSVDNHEIKWEERREKRRKQKTGP